MVMTHYMELLSLYQPWNLIIFMLVPMVLAETILASGIFTLFYKGGRSQRWQTISHIATIVLGIFFICVTIYLGVAYIPTIQWRGPIDYIAVWSYILAVIPSILLLAQEFGFMDKTASNEKKTHASRSAYDSFCCIYSFCYGIWHGRSTVGRIYAAESTHANEPLHDGSFQYGSL